MFTIEVKKREKDEEFTFEDVKKEARVFHEDCHRGKVRWRDTEGDQWVFDCQRCENGTFINGPERLKTEIVSTAVDGQERKFKSELPQEDVRVVQKS